MSVRAKMTCYANKPAEGGGATVTLYPVATGSKENEQYFKYTPGGVCTLSILNDAASAQFEIGKEYYVTFEAAS